MLEYILCYATDKDIVYIWFYNETEPVVASYKDYYFKPAEYM